jgi:tRNA(Ile)-lysidine synthase TilS/MesJ
MRNVCVRCVLPRSFPGITFDADGVCSQCNAGDHSHQAEFCERQRAHFCDVVEQNKGTGQYDAIACYSGGKDSTYMLQMMVRQFGLSVLAFTLDNGFITEQSKANITKIVDRLHVDHLFFKPARQFMTRMYRQAILGDLNEPRGNYYTRISDVCLSCITVVNVHAARLALQNRAPMIFAGFTPGQIPRAVIKNNHVYYRETYGLHEAHFEQRLGREAARYLNLPRDDFEIYQMSPFLVYEKSEAVILQQIRELGWEHPEQLDGCSSNCALNAVGNICHEKKYGVHPYALELSKLVRKGLLERNEALQKLSQAGDARVIENVFAQLEISGSELVQLKAA